MKNLTFEQLPQAVAQLFDHLEDIKALINTREVTSHVEEDKLLNVYEAAELLRLSPTSIYGLVHRKQIPALKRGKRLYFSKVEITNWIKGGRKLTQQELNTAAEAHIANLKQRR